MVGLSKVQQRKQQEEDRAHDRDWCQKGERETRQVSCDPIANKNTGEEEELGRKRTVLDGDLCREPPASYDGAGRADAVADDGPERNNVEVLSRIQPHRYCQLGAPLA